MSLSFVEPATFRSMCQVDKGRKGRVITTSCALYDSHWPPRLGMVTIRLIATKYKLNWSIYIYQTSCTAAVLTTPTRAHSVTSVKFLEKNCDSFIFLLCQNLTKKLRKLAPFRNCHRKVFRVLSFLSYLTLFLSLLSFNFYLSSVSSTPFFLLWALYLFFLQILSW